jgi:hypothetical protein
LSSKQQDAEEELSGLQVSIWFRWSNPKLWN